MTALVFSGVRKTFGPTVALEGLDLIVKPGELISLLGPSGCGKTTALRIAAGFERPNTGTVSVNGNDLTNTPAHKRNMGMVFQSYSSLSCYTVLENAALGLKIKGVGKKDREELALSQNNKCKICEKEESANRRLAIDHCHKTGIIRGMLCTNCNLGIGNLQDNISLLYKAIEYLKETSLDFTNLPTKEIFI